MDKNLVDIKNLENEKQKIEEENELLQGQYDEYRKEYRLLVLKRVDLHSKFNDLRIKKSNIDDSKQKQKGIIRTLVSSSVLSLVFQSLINFGLINMSLLPGLLAAGFVSVAVTGLMHISLRDDIKKVRRNRQLIKETDYESLSSEINEASLKIQELDQSINIFDVKQTAVAKKRELNYRSCKNMDNRIVDLKIERCDALEKVTYCLLSPDKKDRYLDQEIDIMRTRTRK